MSAERKDPLGPPLVGEPTYAEPDQQNTMDALSPRARAAREALREATDPGASDGEKSGPAANAPPFDGMRIGRYQLLEMVGAGGMGMVWGAWDPELERRVALKLVQPTVLEARERILTEGQALAKLSHPNVVPIYDVGVMGAQVYLVMEWVRGTTLRAYAREAASSSSIDAKRCAGSRAMPRPSTAAIQLGTLPPRRAVSSPSASLSEKLNAY